MKLLVKLLKRIVPIIFIFFAIFEIQRSFTNFPEIHTNVLNGNVSSSMKRSLNIEFYLGNWSTFAYFTTLSNILFVMTLFLNWTFGFRINPYWKLAVNIYMIITCIIFWAIIAPFFVWGANGYFDYIYIHEHLIVVIASLAWYHFEKEKIQIKKSFAVTMIFPIIYLIFSIIIQIISGGEVAVYPFLNFKDVLSVGLPVGASIVISILLIASICMLLILINFLYLKPQAFRLLTNLFKRK